MYNLSKEIYGITSVIDYYMQKHNDIDDIDTITPVLKFLKKTTDDLYYFLMCIDDNNIEYIESDN